MSLIVLILIFLIIALMYLKMYLKIYLNPYKEKFVTNLSIVDPYSLYLHDDISNREDWWHHIHTKNMYYYHNMVPIHYKE